MGFATGRDLAAENKARQRRFVEAYQGAHDEAVADELLAAGFVNHTAPEGIPPDREGVKQLFRMFWTAFPDLRPEIHDMAAEGDRVVTRKTFHGTHSGPFMGLPPTGKRVSIEVIDIVRYEDGQIAEHWNLVDKLGLMRQLGVA